jgi:hypothetical protein
VGGSVSGTLLRLCSPMPAPYSLRMDPWFHFWQRLLFAGFLVQAVVGYIVAFAYDSPLLAWHAAGVGQGLWGRPEYTVEVAAYRDFIMGVLGATMAGSALVMAWVVAIPFARRERWAWACLATALLAWAPVDTALSLHHGVTINALFNVTPVVLMAAPLLATRRAFFPRSPARPAATAA